MKFPLLTSKSLLNLSQFHGGPVGGEADAVELGQGFEQSHHFGVIPVGALCLVTGNEGKVNIDLQWSNDLLLT